MIYSKIESLRDQRNFTKLSLAKAIGKSRQWYADIYWREQAEYEADIKEIQHQMGHSSVAITDEYLKSMVGWESEFFKKKMPEL